MINKTALPENFSGVVKFTKTTTDYQTGTDTVVIYIYHYRNSELHREDGPAVLLEGKPHEWWVQGRQYSEEEYCHFLEKKALKEKLASKFGEKESTSRGKI